VTLTPQTLRCLHRGRALFDAGRHWDAHEAWEDAWQDESGEPRQLLQGLIQVAAAMHKALVQLQPGPCCKLLEMALEKLDPLPASAGSLDLARFRDDARTALAHARQWLHGAAYKFDPQLVPRLHEAE
jgi:hypothetical protein